MYYKVKISTSTGTFRAFSALPVETGDEVMVETRKGLCKGKVYSIEEETPYSPWEETIDAEDKYHMPRASCKGVVENITKGIAKEANIMLGYKIVRCNVAGSVDLFLYTELDLQIGDTVIIDHTDSLDDAMYQNTLRLGTVAELDVARSTAFGVVVCVADLSTRLPRRQSIKRSMEIREKLDAKVKAFKELEMIRLIAAQDPETAALLEEYKASSVFNAETMQ